MISPSKLYNKVNENNNQPKEEEDNPKADMA
jgi:hypothetical protein